VSNARRRRRYFEKARYNIGPSQAVPIVRQTPPGTRECVFVRWGLVPSWADPKIGYSLINAWSDGVEKKPSFWAAFKSRRCLVVSNGFYESKHTGTKPKQPYFFQLQGGDVFGFAGLWESWCMPNGGELETCTIIPTAANELIKPVHKRMPVIPPSADQAAWLETGFKKPVELLSLLRPFSAEGMESWPVNTVVSSSRSEGAECWSVWRHRRCSLRHSHRRITTGLSARSCAGGVRLIRGGERFCLTHPGPVVSEFEYSSIHKTLSAAPGAEQHRPATTSGAGNGPGPWQRLELSEWPCEGGIGPLWTRGLRAGIDRGTPFEACAADGSLGACSSWRLASTIWATPVTASLMSSRHAMRCLVAFGSGKGL
jgi:putative SOS response-associated peptidase YedK